MIWFLQTNLGRGQESQNLLMETATERKVDVLFITEQYRLPEIRSWFKDTLGRAAIAMLNHDLTIKQFKANYVCVELEGVRMYSCYFLHHTSYGTYCDTYIRVVSPGTTYSQLPPIHKLLHERRDNKEERAIHRKLCTSRWKP